MEARRHGVALEDIRKYVSQWKDKSYTHTYFYVLVTHTVIKEYMKMFLSIAALCHDVTEEKVAQGKKMASSGHKPRMWDTV